MPSKDEIRQARTLAGLTQKAAAELIDAHPMTWTRYETGTRDMPETIWKLFKHVAGIERIPYRK